MSVQNTSAFVFGSNFYRKYRPGLVSCMYFVKGCHFTELTHKSNMDDCLVQLSSKSHHGNILGALHQMRLGGELIDITVHVDHQGEVEEFQAHQVMLAANSGYFKRLLLSQEAVPDKLFLSNMIRTTYFSTFLEFVYTGKVEVARDKIVDVQAVADLLDCKDLLEVCGTAMSSCFTKEPEAEECSPVHGSERAAEEGPGSSAKKWLKQALKRKSPLKSANRGRPKKLKKVSDTAKEKDVSPEDGGIRRVSIRLAGRKIPVGVLKMRDSAEEDSDNPGPDSTDPDNPDPDSTSEMEDGEAAANPAAPTENPADNEEEFQKAQRVSNIDSGRDDDDDDDDDNNNDDDKEDHGEGEENTVEDGLDDLPYQREEEEGREESERSSKRTSKAQFQCESCQRTFHYERSYLKHISTYHGVKAEVTYRCETCQQTFANRGNLKIHEKHVHSDERLFSCQVCTKTFKRKKDVIRHQRQVHEGGAQRHICPECGKTLSSKTALSLHERTHTGAKPFECTVCASRFTQSSALKMHQRTHTGEKPFACDLCEAKFTQKHMLAYHKRSHTGEKPFMCESCGKSFASKEYLRHHSNIHTGSRPYKCKQCGRGFAQRNSLHQHLKIHTGERPYSCKDCTKQFTQLNALQRHQRIHTGEKPYMCGLCNRTFTDKSTVRRHTMTHDTDAPWKNYLVVLEGNVDDKKSKPSPGGKAERSAAGEDRATAGVGDTVNSEGATVQTQAEAIVVPAQPVTLPADWASHGTIALVSHGSLGGITVIHTEVPHGTQIQPIVTTDATGASVISLDGSSITVPFALPISMAHTIPVSTVASASSLALPVSLDVPVSEVATAPAASTASVLEAAASQTILATASGAAAGEADIQEVVLCEKHYNTDADTVPGDELQKAAEDMSSEEVEEASTEQTV